MKISSTRRAVVALTVATAALGAAGCGSSTLNTGTSTSGSPSASSGSIPTVTADPALVAKLPAAIKAKGTLADGSDASYPPNEYVASDGKTIVGMDIDLLNAVAATMGLKVTYTNADFGTIIGGVTSGKYDIAISSFTINAQRMQQVNMTQYFNSPIAWAARTGQTIDPKNACGKTVAVQTDTVEVTDTQELSKKCVAEGKKPITIISEIAQTKVAADVMAGKADAMSADLPITIYAVQQSKGLLESVGTPYSNAPYGIVTSKDDGGLAQVISEALAKLKTDGVYDAILKKWGVEAGAVDTFPVNPKA